MHQTCTYYVQKRNQFDIEFDIYSPAVPQKAGPKTEPDSKNFRFSDRNRSRNRELKNNRTGIGTVGTEKLFDDN